MMRVVEHVGIGATRLIGVADGAAAVAVDEVGVDGLFEGVVEFRGEPVGTAHQGGQSMEVVRHGEGALPGIGFHPTLSAEGVGGRPLTVQCSGQDQADIRVEHLFPARCPFREMLIVVRFAQFLRHLCQGPIFEGPLDDESGALGFPAVLVVEGVDTHAAAREMIAFHGLVGVFDVDFAEEPLLVGGGDEAGCRASGHNEGVPPGGGTAWQGAAVVRVAHQGGGEVIQQLGPAETPEHIEVPLRQPEGIGIVHVERGFALGVAGQAMDAQGGVRARVGCGVHVDGVIAAGIIEFVPAQERVPEVGVELDLLGSAAAADADLAQPVVPFLSGVGTNLVEGPVGTFQLQVVEGVVDAGKGEADFDLKRITGLQSMADGYAGLFFGRVLEPVIPISGDALRCDGHGQSLQVRDAFLALPTGRAVNRGDRSR
jgi:hypothetical protein